MADEYLSEVYEEVRSLAPLGGDETGKTVANLRRYVRNVFEEECKNVEVENYEVNTVLDPIGIQGQIEEVDVIVEFESDQSEVYLMAEGPEEKTTEIEGILSQSLENWRDYYRAVADQESKSDKDLFSLFEHRGF